jgi:hypothetical protein
MIYVQTMKKTHIGSKWDDFPENERLLEVPTVTATKRVIAHQIATEMKRRRLTKMAMASRMKTSRAALDRLLDPKSASFPSEKPTLSGDVKGKKPNIPDGSRNGESVTPPDYLSGCGAV